MKEIIRVCEEAMHPGLNVLLFRLIALPLFPFDLNLLLPSAAYNIDA
jgi:hypothetical protein